MSATENHIVTIWCIGVFYPFQKYNTTQYQFKTNFALEFIRRQFDFVIFFYFTFFLCYYFLLNMILLLYTSK